MKLSREGLKSIVKECLVELLAEGLGGNLSEAVQSRAKPVAKRQHEPLVTRRPTSALIEAVKTESRGDSVLASILADTAATTLPNQLAHSSPSGDALSHAPPTPEARVIAEHSPEDIFGQDAASKWAALAFAVPKKPS